MYDLCRETLLLFVRRRRERGGSDFVSFRLRVGTTHTTRFHRRIEHNDWPTSTCTLISFEFRYPLFFKETFVLHKRGKNQL